MKLKRTGWMVLTAMALAVAGRANANNLLLIIGDDIGLDSLHISNTSTNATYPTIPTLQGLAEKGVLFSNGYAYPTCSPTRSAIMTGRYGYRTGVLSPQSSGNFSGDEYALPEVFADQGLDYELASFGKWHLGGGNSGPNTLGGWPHFSGALSGGLSNYRRWTKVVNGVSTNLTAAYATRENVTDTIAWINEQGTNQWFAWIGFNAAHTPLHTPPSDMYTTDLTGLDSSTTPRPFFEAMIEAMDYQINRLLGNIDTNDTTIIFLGDNGTAAGVIQSPYDIAGRAKGSLYEGGTHVPFFVYGADVVNGGRTNDSVVHCADLFATIIELAGGTVPLTGEDSRSLVPILEDQPFLPTDACILVESDVLLGGSTSGRAIRDTQYKLIRIVGRDDRLYDMNADPLEASDLLDGSLTDDQQAAYQALSDKLNAWTNTPDVVVIPTNGYPVVDSGQLDCYDDQGGYTIAAPTPGAAFAGQDAQYTGKAPSYLKHGDGTVTDLNTGLMWQQTPDLVNKSSFASAVADAVNQTTGGHTDWRLPTLKELYSLIDFSGNTGSSELDAIPYIDTNTFDFVYGDPDTERYIDAQYWSATEYIGVTMANDETVFGVNFADGRIKGYPKYKQGGSDNLAFVRYVRGNTAYGINDFQDNGNGTVSDRATELMWQQGDSATTLNWEQALAYAEGLELAGYRDWRLPNAKELQSIVDYTRAPLITGSAAIDTNYFDVTETESFYWTSTTHLDGAPNSRGNYAVYLSFGQAFGWMPVPPGQTTTYELYDVHGAGAQRSDPKSGTPVLEAPGHGPQGDILRINNYVRCVRAGATEPPTDTDGDGLTDWYENNYSASITGMVATADDDHDGASNEDERDAGTIPTESNSFFRVTSTSASTATVVVTWSSELGKTYAVQRSTNLLFDAFTDTLDSGITATPPLNTHTSPPLSGAAFHRVVVE